MSSSIKGKQRKTARMGDFEGCQIAYKSCSLPSLNSQFLGIAAWPLDRARLLPINLSHILQHTQACLSAVGVSYSIHVLQRLSFRYATRKWSICRISLVAAAWIFKLSQLGRCGSAPCWTPRETLAAYLWYRSSNIYYWSLLISQIYMVQSQYGRPLLLQLAQVMSARQDGISKASHLKEARLIQALLGSAIPVTSIELLPRQRQANVWEST